MPSGGPLRLRRRGAHCLVRPSGAVRSRRGAKSGRRNPGGKQRPGWPGLSPGLHQRVDARARASRTAGGAMPSGGRSASERGAHCLVRPRWLRERTRFPGRRNARGKQDGWGLESRPTSASRQRSEAGSRTAGGAMPSGGPPLWLSLPAHDCGFPRIRSDGRSAIVSIALWRSQLGHSPDDCGTPQNGLALFCNYGMPLDYPTKSRARIPASPSLKECCVG